MKMTKREKTLIGILIVLVFVCAYWLLFLNPQIKAMAALKTETAEAQTELQNRTLKKIESDQLQKDINEKKEQTEKISAGISHGFDQPAILVYLSKIVENNAVKQTFSFGAIRQIRQMYACPVSILMQSDYKGLKSVLNALSGGEYFVKITGLMVQLNNEAAAAENASGEDDAKENADSEDNTAGQEEPKTDNAPPASPSQALSEKLNVTINMEFYSTAEDGPSDAVYAFDSGYQFGGDIFE